MSQFIKNALKQDSINTKLYNELIIYIKKKVNNIILSNLSDTHRLYIIDQFKIISTTDYLYLKAAVLLDLGIMYLEKNENIEACEYLLQAAECGPEAFGYNLDNSKKYIFPLIYSNTFEIAPWYIGQLTNSGVIKPETELFIRVVKWINHKGLNNICHSWNVISCYHRGMYLCIFENNVTLARNIWNQGSQILDEDIKNTTLVTQNSYGIIAKKLCIKQFNNEITIDSIKEIGGTPIMCEIYNNIERVCCTCKQTDKKLYICKRCYGCFYCGKECQKKNWSDHKSNCKPIDIQTSLIKV